MVAVSDQNMTCGKLREFYDIGIKIYVIVQLNLAADRSGLFYS